MNRRWKKRTLAVGAATMLLTACAPAPPGPDPVADLLLLVTFEGLPGRSLGCEGNPRARTPHLDRFSRTGVTAANAVGTPLGTRPGLATLLTGLTPGEHGLRHDTYPLGPGRTLAEVLRDEGFRTAAFATTPAADRRHGLGRGFERHSVIPGDALARSFADWRDDPSEAPAFVWIHLRGVDPTDADDSFARVRDVAGADAFVVVTVPDAPRPDPAVPVLVAGPTVAPGIRSGLTYTGDVCAIIAAAAAGSDHLKGALENPPADREIPLPAPFAPPAEAMVALNRGRDLQRAGDPAAAADAFATARIAEPRLVEALAREADLCRRLGRTQDAVDRAQEVLALVPEHPDARVLLARLLAAQRDAKAARKWLTPVLDASPSHAGALAARAELALLAGDSPAAVRDLRAALANVDLEPGTLVDIGTGLSKVGLHADAVRTVRRAVNGGDRSPPTRYTLGFVLQKSERFQESVSEYTMLIREHPAYLPPYRNLGMLMAKDGEIERAILLWERGLEHHPDDAGLLANVKTAREALGLATLGDSE